MGKELVISANRHETKVALLEDDQVVEVYFQRKNEYSLAGSIHKGRVTRVLPGMQSAFVDIGLDRDAFLYVSDFFEDNEEYDRIAGAAEDKVMRAERERAAAVDVRPPAVTEPPAPPPEAAPPERSERAERAERPERPERSDRGEKTDREDDRRGGRRSRRRRTRGHGFPESKYTDVARSHEPEERPEPPAAGEFPVLPGESLAKYSSKTPSFDGDTLEQGAEDTEVSGAQPGTGGEVTAEPDLESAPAVAEAYEPDQTVEVLVAEEPAEPAGGVSAAETDEAPEEADEAAGAQTEPEAEEPEAEAPDSVAELPDQAVPEIQETSEEAPASEGEEVEPARMPVSLTATLREQGHRYIQHRVSRRMRRKMRGTPATGPEQRTEEPVEPEGRADTRTARAEKVPQPSISELLKEGQEILVQIAKEPLGQKGARITSHIALPGRYVVYMPTVDHMGVSRKIASDDERQRLKRILQTHRTGMPGGFIVRTAGEGKSEHDIAADMRFLYNLWLDIRQKAEARPAPALIHHDLDVVSRILRDQMTESFKAIWADSEDAYTSVLGFVQRFQPAAVSRVKLYTRDTPIFDAFSITPELEKALRPKVWLKSGGYIVINQTEALVAVDVNTGKFVGKSNRLEDTIYKTNTEAIKEIVRQIRLRDLGGIIVIDFIDMDERKNRQKVSQALDEAMRADRAPNKILQFNDFGLVAITRKRVKQSLERTLCSPCPYCESAGYVKSVSTVVGEILQEARKLAKVIEGKDAVLRVNPEVARLFKSSDNTFLEELEEILGRPVMVTGDATLHQEKFDLV